MNVLLYVLDSLRPDHLSCYGYDRQTSPTIDRLAEEGILFENCISPATWTRPVASSILTGLYPKVHGTEGHRDAFNPPVPTIASRFQNAGYETFGLSSGRNIQSSWGFDNGFDTFCNLFNHEAVLSSDRPKSPHFDDGTPLARAEDINMAFEEWFETFYDSSEPFFSFLWSNETHLPYSPPDDFRGYADENYEGPIDAVPDHRHFDVAKDQADFDQLIGYYDGEIRYNDKCLGDLLSYLNKVGVYEDTMVIVAGDHGDAFGEHGEYGHANTPPYEEVVRVPLVIRPPNGLADGKTTTSMASLVDIYPTIVGASASVPTDPIDEQLQGEALDLKQPDNDDRFAFSKGLVEQPYGVTDRWHAVYSAEMNYLDFEPGERNLNDRVRMVTEGLSLNVIKKFLSDPIGIFRSHVIPQPRADIEDTESDSGRTQTTDSEETAKAQLKDALDVWLENCEELRSRLDTEEKRIEVSATTQERLQQLGYASE